MVLVKVAEAPPTISNSTGSAPPAVSGAARTCALTDASAQALTSTTSRPRTEPERIFGAASIAWLFYYSFAVWRDDTERVPVTGTRPGGAEDH